MSRSTQFVGLPEEAHEYVRYLRRYPIKRSCFGMFGESISLGSWIDKDGSVLQEVVQAEPWSSGPVIFTQLMKNHHRFISWTEEQIQSV